jgi:uncharacterized membrane protein (DUF485 family)
MSDQLHNTTDSKNDPPSPDELQKKAKDVWGILKMFFAGLFIIALLVIGFAFYWLFTTFGIIGVLVGAIFLVVGLVLFCRHLLTY